MKQVKNYIIFSDGSCYFNYNIVISIKSSQYIFQKKDHKNFSFNNKKKSKIVYNRSSTFYKKKIFS